MLAHLDKAFQKGEAFNIHPYYHELTMDIICRIAMGQRGSKQFENPNVDMAKAVFAKFGTGMFDTPANLFPALGQALRSVLLFISHFKTLPFKQMIDTLYVAVETRKRERVGFSLATKDGSFLSKNFRRMAQRLSKPVVTWISLTCSSMLKTGMFMTMPSINPG